MSVTTNTIFPHILKDIKSWPIVRFCSNITPFKKKLVESVYKDLLEKYGDNLKTELENCAYSELNRLNNSPWKIDPPEEKLFWTEMRKDLIGDQSMEAEEKHKYLLKRIINRYVEEIVGDFKEETFNWIRLILPIFLNRIFNADFKGSIFYPFKKSALKNRLLLAGHIDETRELFKKGLVILLPTHQSNLDSIMVGYLMDYKLGLPAFSYGAGLNLFNYEIPAYFMSKLGAYKVDRRKKNSIYMNSLLEYSKHSISNGVNTIFFPGGTRSRSGQIETELKTGLLSSLIGAQFEKIKNGDDKKIFVVPVVLNYHSVLEARSLIYSYLKNEGKTKYLSRSKYKEKMNSTIWLIRFMIRLFTQKSDFVLSLGHPLDVLGNRINQDGESIDATGKIIDISDYFRREGELVDDSQRDSVYTKYLSKSVAKSYLEHNVVFCSHIVAFAAFKCFIEELNVDSIYSIFKYNERDVSIGKEKLLIQVDSVLDQLFKLENKGRILLDDEVKSSIDDVVQKGIDRLGVFHVFRVLYIQKGGRIKTGDFGLLYYYSNRLSFLNS
ncbi:MAG: 1-acyl-sn-glycerol-3-phosphate acyltransferase [Deltaproteobacteria bacterium]